MTAVSFNTLQFATKLKEAGIPEKQAEVLANSFGEMLQVNLKELVTEQQLTNAKNELKQELKSVETRLDAKIDVSVANLTNEIRVLKWMTGTMFAAVIAILIRLFFFRVV